MSFLVIMSLLNGLTLAALLFITASGLTLSFSLMRVVNLTHGALYMAGGFIGLSVISLTGSWLLALFAGGAVRAVLALLEEKHLLRWARGRLLGPQQRRPGAGHRRCLPDPLRALRGHRRPRRTAHPAGRERVEAALPDRVGPGMLRLC